MPSTVILSKRRGRRYFTSTVLSRGWLSSSTSMWFLFTIVFLHIAAATSHPFRAGGFHHSLFGASFGRKQRRDGPPTSRKSPPFYPHPNPSRGAAGIDSLQSSPPIETETALSASTSPSLDPSWISRVTAMLVPATTTTASTPFTSVQTVGETIFATTVLLAALQGLVFVLQYRTNPSGQLQLPPGPTIGTAQPTGHAEDARTNATNGSKDDTLQSSGTSVPTYTQLWTTFNRWLFLLLPWVSRKVSFVILRNTHLFHLGFIVALAKLVDLMPDTESKSPSPIITAAQKSSGFNRRTNSTLADREHAPVKDTKHTTLDKVTNIVVIGDSLAVGLGCVNTFDKEKNSSIPFMRIENVSNTSKTDDRTGPVFPRVLAESLAESLNRTVHWRSAGVDGGDVEQVEEYCLGVIDEECAAKRPPDMVVILHSGINDLKKTFVQPSVQDKVKQSQRNPFNAPRRFRNSLDHLIQEIQLRAPNTTVIMPSLPSQMFARNSPLNVFPLSVILDTVVGSWDSQKKILAQQYDGSVLYMLLNPMEIFDWYQEMERTQEDKAPRFYNMEGTNDQVSPSPKKEVVSLISADGIHPSAKCYEFWAQSVAKNLLSSMTGPDEHQNEQTIKDVADVVDAHNLDTIPSDRSIR